MKGFLKVIGIGIVAILIFVLCLVLFADHKQKENEKLQQAVQASIQATKEATKPPMPINIQFRKALIDPSYVLMLSNTSARDLQIMATFINPTTQARKSFTISIAPNGRSDMGYAQGWAFHSGDKVYLQHADYSNKDVSIP
jgi:hypothetical protein